jgi:hypothetical protein
MATADYQPKLVRDARLNDVSSQIEYAVSQGANQNTYQVYNSNTSSSSNITFNITPPSESVVIDRHVLLRCKVKFQITLTAGAAFGAGYNSFMYGTRDGFKSFPLHGLFTTCTATINNTSISMNVQDVLPSLLRQMDMEDLAYYQGMTPIALDKYKNYGDGLASNNNPLGAYSIASHNYHWQPRGTHPLDYLKVEQFTGANNANGNTTKNNTNNTNTRKFVITVEATFTEPLFISPFLVHSKYNQAGLLGVNNINLNFNVDSSLKQFWVSGAPLKDSTGADITYTIALDPATPFDAKLLVNYLTPQETNLLPARNIVPFVDYPRYITSANNTDEVATGTSKTYTLNNIQLNQIPDKILICARKALSSQTWQDTSTFLPITKVSINFNNASGLLSSATQQDLWRISVANNSKQSWYDFSGKCGISIADDVAFDGNAKPSSVYSEGSVLVLDPSKNLSLPAYLSNGSIGQFSLQMDIEVFNTTGGNLKPEFCVICCNSGLFATIAGSSVVRTGLLNMDIVSQLASTSQESAISSSDYQEMSGGALNDQVASALRNLPLKKKAGARSGGAMPKSKLDMLSY